MAITREQKTKIVSELNEVAQSALSAVTADYCGLSVAQMNSLRAKARAKNVYLRVVRNTLVKRAVEDTDFVCLTQTFSGPILLAFSKDEPGAAARLLRDFSFLRKPARSVPVLDNESMENLIVEIAIHILNNMKPREESNRW